MEVADPWETTKAAIRELARHEAEARRIEAHHKQTQALIDTVIKIYIDTLTSPWRAL